MGRTNIKNAWAVFKDGSIERVKTMCNTGVWLKVETHEGTVIYIYARVTSFDERETKYILDAAVFPLTHSKLDKIVTEEQEC